MVHFQFFSDYHSNFLSFVSAWVDEDWKLKFDNAGTHECGGTKTLMSGFGRSSCTELSCLEQHGDFRVLNDHYITEPKQTQSHD